VRHSEQEHGIDRNEVMMASGSKFLGCDNSFSHCVTMTTVFVSVCFGSCFLGTGIAGNCSPLSRACRLLSLCDNVPKEIVSRWQKESFVRLQPGGGDATQKLFFTVGWVAGRTSLKFSQSQPRQSHNYSACSQLGSKVTVKRGVEVTTLRASFVSVRSLLATHLYCTFGLQQNT
jgi:hypothetical protein